MNNRTPRVMVVGCDGSGRSLRTLAVTTLLLTLDEVELVTAPTSYSPDVFTLHVDESYKLINDSLAYAIMPITREYLSCKEDFTRSRRYKNYSPKPVKWIKK